MLGLRASPRLVVKDYNHKLQTPVFRCSITILSLSGTFRRICLCLTAATAAIAGAAAAAFVHRSCNAPARSVFP
eukprot:11191532-Lingulodinium_polyedra.AAC.1